MVFRFAHRFNENGSYDSICTGCLLTLSTAKTEADLAQHERSHVCDPIRLYQLDEPRSEFGAIANGVQLS
jgi:hypothetical protein